MTTARLLVQSFQSAGQATGTEVLLILFGMAESDSLWQHCNRKSTCLDMDVSKDDVYIYPNGNVNRENDDYQLGFRGTMCSDMPV